MMTAWKNIMLAENADSTMITNRYQIYCDLDGVLVNFAKGAEKIINDTMQKIKADLPRYEKMEKNVKNPVYKEYKLARKVARIGHGWDYHYTWDQINKEGPNHIKPLRDLMYFLAARSQSWWDELEWLPGGKELWAFIEPHNPIILTSGMGPRSEAGKRSWCQRELGLSGDRVLVVADKGVPTGDKTGILIDDREKPLGQFRGIGILFKSTGQAIEELKNYGFE
jgi:5'(3')-deoxyribonucleotidase